MISQKTILIIIASITISLIAAASSAFTFNDRALAILDKSLQQHSIERISLGSIFWNFRTMGKDYTVFVPASRLQQTFTSAFENVEINYNADLDYWVLLAACLLPSLTVYALSGARFLYPFLMAPVFILAVVYCLGLRVQFHTNEAQMTIQIQPHLNALAVETWSIDGSCPTVWVSHLRRMSICVHETSTCAGHVCDESCKKRKIELSRVPSDEMFPFSSIKD